MQKFFSMRPITAVLETLITAKYFYGILVICIVAVLPVFDDIVVKLSTAWKVSKYGVFSGPYFPVFSPNIGKYAPEKTLYFDIG